MKMLSKLFFLSACLVVANGQAGEPENKRFRGGFFVGMGIPTFTIGHCLDKLFGGKDILTQGTPLEFGEILFRGSGSALGKSLKGTGAGLVLIPMIINRQLIVDKVKNASQYRLKLEENKA